MNKNTSAKHVEQKHRCPVKLDALTAPFLQPRFTPLATVKRSGVLKYPLRDPIGVAFFNT